MAEAFKLVFEGKIAEGSEIEDVKKKLISLLKIDEKGIERIFTGGPVVIKKKVTKETAEKYQKAFKFAGAILKVEPAKKEAALPVTAEDDESTSDRADKIVCPACGFEQPDSPECVKCGTSFVEEGVTVVVKEAKKEDLLSAEADKIVCPACGFEQPDSPECVKCGTSFTKEDETIIVDEPPGDVSFSREAKTISCPACGFVQKESVECIKCGTSFEQEDKTVFMQDLLQPAAKGEAQRLEAGDIILTNIETIPGRTIVEHFGLVSGSTIRAKHIGRDIMAGLKNIVGGELKGYTELLNESRQQAIERMVEQARQLGGNAIINIRFSTSSVAQGAAELYAYGTAVRVK